MPTQRTSIRTRIRKHDHVLETMPSTTVRTTLDHPVYLLPGWLNSGPTHWQSQWERVHGMVRVEQSEWTWPRRGDWMARLDEVLLQDEATRARPAVLVAHSLGCHLVAAWAAHSLHTARVAAALLVALPDLERDDMPPNLVSWRPIVGDRLPFAATAVVSSDDPFTSPERARALALRWGAAIVEVGALGHVNADSGLGLWPEGLALLQGLVRGLAPSSEAPTR